MGYFPKTFQRCWSRVRTQLGNKAFQYAAPASGNSLQLDLKLSEPVTLWEFKSILKDWENIILSQCDCFKHALKPLRRVMILNFDIFNLCIILLLYCMNVVSALSFIVATLYLLPSWPGFTWLSKGYNNKWHSVYCHIVFRNN